MEYEEAESYLLEIPRFTTKNTLDDTKAFLEKLGRPDRDQNIIHIAGTNGKGSVCAYLASVFGKAGYRVGMFTSPHLVTMRERFRMDGEMISKREFLACFEQVQEAVSGGLPGNPAYHPTFFETLFFMAMLYFKRNGAEIVILETGLGGRLDATNSVEKKELCVITQIGYDHMEYLGDTIERIAGEKAGILQKNVPVVFADNRAESSGVIKRRAETLGCPAFSVSKRDVRNLEFHKNFIDFSYDTRYYGIIKCFLSAHAPYQAENAALALGALDALAERLPVGREALLAGMREARWEARMEEIFPDVYVDGAHNADGIQAFLDAVHRNGSGRKLLLFSAVRDKQYEEIIRLLTSPETFDSIFVTELNNTRGLSLRTMQEAFAKTGVVVYGFSDTGSAFDAILAAKQPGDTVYIAGSLYLAGEVKNILREFRLKDRADAGFSVEDHHD